MLERLDEEQQKAGDGLYTFYLPNCSKNGFYYSKQVCPHTAHFPPTRCPLPPRSSRADLLSKNQPSSPRSRQPGSLKTSSVLPAAEDTVLTAWAGRAFSPATPGEGTTLLRRASLGHLLFVSPYKGKNYKHNSIFSAGQAINEIKQRLNLGRPLGLSEAQVLWILGGKLKTGQSFITD